MTGTIKSTKALHEYGQYAKSVERTVIDTKIMCPSGETVVSFDGEDLLDTLEAVRDEDVAVTWPREKVDYLKAKGILEDEGNARWCSPARLGPKGEEYIELLERIVRGEDP